MGYRGKLEEQEEARRLRSSGMTMPDIALRTHRSVMGLVHALLA